MAYAYMQDMTHKQLATIVLNPATQQDEKDWARYYALIKKPWKPIPAAKKKSKEKA